MHEKLIEFVNRYNFEKILKSLNYQTPMQYLLIKKNITPQRIVIKHRYIVEYNSQNRRDQKGKKKTASSLSVKVKENERW